MYTETIKTELKEYLNDFIADNNLVKWNSDDNDLHQEAFNNDYYLIGYYNCSQWLKKHNIDPFEAIAFVQNYERENFGDDAVRTYDNAETTVNMIVYIIGEEVTNELYTQTI